VEHRNRVQATGRDHYSNRGLITTEVTQGATHGPLFCLIIITVELYRFVLNLYTSFLLITFNIGDRPMTVRELREELLKIKDQDSEVKINLLRENQYYHIEGKGPPINSFGNIKGEDLNNELYDGAGLMVVEKRRPFLKPAVVIYAPQFKGDRQ
jgi:hypothetical protein